MSTSDPASAERPAPDSTQDSGTRTLDNLSAVMVSLPDAAVIARLANEFFAALPGNVTAPDSVGATMPAGALPVPPSVPSAPAGIQANPPALTQELPDAPVPPAVPGSLAYFLDQTSPLNVAPSLPSLNDAFSFPSVSGAQAVPGIPGVSTSGLSAPLTESDLRAIPASLGNLPAFAPRVGG